MSKEREPTASESERWPIGRSILRRIRGQVNEEGGAFAGGEDEDVFQTLYLTERFGCLPHHLLGDDLLLDIRSLCYYVLDGVRSELEERIEPREFMWIAIDASYEDTTVALLLMDEKLLLAEHSKAWNFYWESEDAMAEELEDWYARAAERLPSRPRVERLPGEGSQYAITLQTERLIRVRTEDPQEALERALLWKDNEDDPDVQVQYEEVRGHHIRRVEPGPEEQPQEAPPSNDASPSNA